MLDSMLKKLILFADILAIGFSGWVAGLTMAKVNEYLQFIVLIATLIGIIWRSRKRNKKHEKN